VNFSHTLNSSVFWLLFIGVNMTFFSYTFCWACGFTSTILWFSRHIFRLKYYQ
jgi:hypothetical protein